MSKVVKLHPSSSRPLLQLQSGRDQRNVSGGWLSTFVHEGSASRDTFHVYTEKYFSTKSRFHWNILLTTTTLPTHGKVLLSFFLCILASFLGGDSGKNDTQVSGRYHWVNQKAEDRVIYPSTNTEKKKIKIKIKNENIYLRLATGKKAVWWQGRTKMEKSCGKRIFFFFVNLPPLIPCSLP